ncbi:MAG: DUF262 domain-containing protein [Bacteroides sp.]|nr:DUF262 domain-containing protein [Bacteroides sp.]
MNNGVTYNASIGKLTTFFEMLNDPDRRVRYDQILIPKIQRDYAQGRKGRELTRKRFLNRLFSAIDTSDSETKELDFIYGQKKNGTYIFEPIDGQQRLTTLFLLHLYLGKRSGNDVSVLKGFTYDTRDSSKEFCLKLISIHEDAFKGIKYYIENQWWFTLRWKNDPTISSMLTMLDEIDTHYFKWSKEQLAIVWKRLVTEGKLKFWKLDLEDLKTTDDLYIKMNSRGKPLTSFEHFKAEIEGYIHAQRSGKEGMSAAGKFSLKLDTVWTNLLWQYRNDEVDKDPKHYADNGLDSMFMNIFRRFMIIEGAKAGSDYNQLEKTDILSLSEIVLKDKIKRLDRLTKIMDFFSGLSSVKEFFNSILTNICEEERIEKGIGISKSDYRVYIQNPIEGNVDYLLRCAQWNRMTMPNMLMLEAFFHYAASVESVDFILLRNIIRIVRNLILNSRDEIRAERMGALLRRIDKIVDGQPLDAQISGEFRQQQVAQEIAKLNYISKNPAEEWIIKFTENHKVLCGNLSCYMDGSVVSTGLLELHSKLFHKNADYEQIERMLLTFGDYAPLVNGRKLYGGREWYNWRDDIFNHGNRVTPPILHEAMNTLMKYDAETLETRINEWMRQQESLSLYTWQYYIVRHRGMRHGASSRYVKATDFVSYDYIMMNRNNFNGKHWNPFLFCLSKRMRDLNPKLAEYNAPLIFENEEITLWGHEYGFEIKLKDDTRKTVNIPQQEAEGNMIDSVDRISFVEQQIRNLISSI